MLKYINIIEFIIMIEDKLKIIKEKQTKFIKIFDYLYIKYYY